MVSDQFIDEFENFLDRCFGGWRCVNCGEVLDARIIENRLNRQHRKGISSRNTPVSLGKKHPWENS